MATIKQRQQYIDTTRKTLIEMAFALLEHRFGSIKFDAVEKTGLAEEIRHQLNLLDGVDVRDKTGYTDTQLANTHLYAKAGLKYITDESTDLESVPLGWLTHRDQDFYIKQRQAEVASAPNI